MIGQIYDRHTGAEEVVRKKARIQYDKYKVVEPCKADCKICIDQNTHINRVIKARDDYTKDKKMLTDKDTIYLSSDMQKVILLPRMPGYKQCQFTSRLVTINQTFSPIGNVNIYKRKSTAILWHTGTRPSQAERTKMSLVHIQRFSH